jgi:hypothetical protein
MSITENKQRIGNFTSSEIYKLMTEGKTKGTFGKPALTYIQEKIYERKLKRSLDVEASSKPMLWGKFLESRVHDMLPLGWEHKFDETIVHPKYNFWSGSIDNVNRQDDSVGDTKCLQPKKFCEVVDCLTKCQELNDISLFRDEHPDKYWQLTSNACILGLNYIVPIIYMPYESELEEIRQSVENADLEEPWKYRFITESLKCELAYLPDDSEYKNLNIFRFPLDKGDAILLESKVIAASIIFNS